MNLWSQVLEMSLMSRELRTDPNPDREELGQDDLAPELIGMNVQRKHHVLTTRYHY